MPVHPFAKPPHRPAHHGARMSFHLRIDLDDAAGALVLALATVERRGYAISAVQAYRPDPASPMRVLVGVDSARPIEPLLRHLRNLCHCIEAELDAQIDADAGDAGYSDRDRADGEA